MTVAKIAVTIPKESLKRAKAAVRAGRAKSVSALVSAALDEKLSSDQLARILDAMDAELGPPSKEARAWAKRVLRSS